MIIKKVFLDLDGVLSNLMKSVINIFGENRNKEVYYLHESYGLSEERFWELIYDYDENFWFNIEPYEWADDIYRKVSKYDVYILSSPAPHYQCFSNKFKWVCKYFPDLYKKCYFVNKKEFLAKPDSLLVDDNDDNIEKFIENGGHGILFPQDWNKNRDIVDKMDYFYKQFDLLKNKEKNINYIIEKKYNWI